MHLGRPFVVFVTVGLAKTSMSLYCTPRQIVHLVLQKKNLIIEFERCEIRNEIRELLEIA
jgi:hypothetical protein